MEKRSALHANNPVRTLASISPVRRCAALHVIHASNPAIGHASIKEHAALCVLFLAIDFHAASPVSAFWHVGTDVQVFVVRYARDSVSNAPQESF